MKNYKRLFHFVKGRTPLLILSLSMILIVQILGFISPLLVKSILDDCIMGIEYEWREVIPPAEKNSRYVTYHNKTYVQKRYLSDDDVSLKKVSIVIYKTTFYFVEEEVIDGNKKIEDDKLVISNKDQTKTYEAIPLTAKEVTSFYRPIFKLLIILLVLLFIKMLLTILCTFIQHFSTNRVVNWIARDGRTEAMEAVERLPIKYFEEEPAGKMATRITRDVDGMIILYRQIINLFASVILSFTFAYLGMFYLNYKLALLSFVVYPLVFLWVKFFLKHLKKIASSVNESRSLLTGKINEIINGIHILQIFNFKKQTVEEFDEISEEYKKEQLKESEFSLSLGWNLINVAKALVTTAVVAFFGFQELSFAGIVITAGTIYAYNEYLLKIIEPISIIFTQINQFTHSHVQIERIHKIIEGPKEDDSKVIIPRYKGDVTFDNVWFAYNENDYVLKGVSFNIKAGTTVGLVGATGSGKTSLMSLLLRFYDITDELSGKIYVDNVDITTYSKRSYREHIGIVLQEPILIKGTIASNIRFGKNDVTDKEIEDTLRKIGGGKIIDKFEKGINQPISRSGVNLSAGEKQIISLARVMVFNPSIVVMDEATSHIDTETEAMIEEALKTVCKGRTMIIIAHRLSTIFNADDIIVLDHGLKVEEGTHHELIEKNGVYANIYRAQADSIREAFEKYKF